METLASIDFEAMRTELARAGTAAGLMIRALDQITASLKGSYASSTVGEQWARTWGETVTIKDAGKMLGVCPNTVRKLIAEGNVSTDPTGRVLTRTAAEWANGGKTKNSRKWRV